MAKKITPASSKSASRPTGATGATGAAGAAGAAGLPVVLLPPVESAGVRDEAAGSQMESKPSGEVSGIAAAALDGVAGGMASAREVTHDEIAREAYYRWERGGEDALHNWLGAERELRSGGMA